MNDLESSGLLSTDEPVAEQPAGSATPGAAPASTAEAAAPADAADAASGSKGGTDAGAGEASASDAGGDGSEAEQRVLGPLEGRPDWTEVMDMGSRRVYFWNADTDVVEWEPPAGGTAREVSDQQPTGKQPADGGAAPASAEAVAGAAGPQQQSHGPGADSGAAEAAAAQPAQPAEARTPSLGGGPILQAADARVSTVPKATAAAVPLPSTKLAHRTAGLVERLRVAAGGLFAAAPKLVWLAIEAEVRAKVRRKDCLRVPSERSDRKILLHESPGAQLFEPIIRHMIALS